MAEIDVLKAQIVRDSLSVPWGFRLQGGADFGQPLTILRITAGSPAARIGLKSGDEVTEIGDVVTRNLSHDQASAVIAQYGQSIILTVERRARGNLPTHPVMNPSAASGQQPGRPYDMYDLTSTPNQPQLNPAYQVGPQSYHTASARPFESPALPKAPPPPAPEPQPEYRPQPQPGPPPQQYSTYTDEEEDQGLQQSRTFKILQSLMENDGEPPPPVLFARKTPGIPTATIPGQGPGSHPKVVANRQFNTPIGLYDQGVAMDTMGQKMDSIAVTESKNEQTSSDPTGPKPYVASETMRLVKQLDEEEKMYGRPNFPPAKSSKPPVGRVLDEAVPSKPSPGGAYVPNYQKSKSLAHVIHSSNEQVRRFSTGTKEPQEEKERRLSGSNPPDSLPGYRKVEPPQPSPLTRSVKSESPTPTPYLRPVTKVESSTAVPFTRTVKTESPIPNLLTRPMKADTTTPTPFTRSVKAESPTHTLFTCQVNVENPVPAPFICPVKESPTSTPYAQPVKAESPTTIPYVRQVKAESPTPTSYGHLVKAESPTPLIRPVKAESPTPSPFSRTPNSHSDSGYQTPTSLGSPMHINTTNTESEGNSAPYPYQPVSSPKTPETQTHTFTSSMVVNTSRAQIKLPSSFNSSSTSSPIVSSSAPPETKGNSSPAPSNSSNSSTIVSHSASSSSSSSATSGSYFIPATGLDNAVPVNIATTAATSSIIEAALKPKIRPYKKPEYSDNQSPTDTAQMMVTVSPQYKKSEQTTASTQKQTQQQIVVDEPGFPMATITVLMPEGQHGSELETSSSHGASGRSSPWYQPSHSQLSSSFSPRAEGIQTETKPGTYMMDVSPRATITIPKRRSTSDPPPPEPCTNTDVIILNEAPRATIKIPRTFHCNSESKPESDNPRSEVILNKAPLATANIPVQFQTTSTSASENVKQQPRHSITRPSTAKVDKDTSGTKRLSQTSTNTVTLNEAPRKTIQLTGKFQHDHELEQKEKIEIAASSKEKFQKLASMFQNKEQETQKTIPAPKRTIKIPSTFKQSGETNGKPEKPVRIEPIKLPSSVDKLPTSADICTSEEKHNASIGPVASQNLHTSTVSSHTSHTFQPVSNGRPTGFRSVKPPQAEQAQIVAPVPSYSTADYLETPTSPDLPPPEFPPPPPPPESPPLSPDFCSEFPLPPPPQTDCPVTQTTPDLPPPPAIAAAPGANRKEENAQQLYAKYADLRKDAERGPLQSRTFNALSNMVEGEPEPAAGVSALPPQRSAYREQQQREAQVARPGRPGGPGAQQQAPGAPRVKVFMPQQYNTPLSMYSAQNVVETFQGQAEMQLDQLEQKHPDVISGAQRAVLEDDSGYRATSDF